MNTASTLEETDNCPIFALYLRKIRQQELLYVKTTNKAYNQRSSLSSKPASH
jgi:hypothetical protein